MTSRKQSTIRPTELRPFVLRLLKLKILCEDLSVAVKGVPTFVVS
jgi:hypothetical protein